MSSEAVSSPALTAVQSQWIAKRDLNKKRELRRSYVTLGIIAVAVISAFITQNQKIRWIMGDPNEHYSLWLLIGVGLGAAVLVSCVWGIIVDYRQGKQIGKFPATDEVKEEPTPASIWAPALVVGVFEMALLITWAIIGWNL